MIDPRTVMVAIPCYSGQVTTELVGMLLNYARFGALTMPTECSHVALVRNLIAAQFMASHFEWLVGIDADIVPTSRRDFECLLEPCDVETRYLEEYEEKNESPPATVWTPPRPSRTTTALVIDRAPGEPIDLNNKMVSAADILVVSEYAYKQDTFEPVKLGMGFVRIHRSVFERLQELKHPLSDQYAALVSERDRLIDLRKRLTLEGKEEWALAIDLDKTIATVAGNLPDPGGGPRLWYGSHKGRMYWDYYPSGPLISQYIPNAEWKGEDHGFFTLCMLAGITPRIETRTRLLHMGRKAYPYLGTDAGGGQ